MGSCDRIWFKPLVYHCEILGYDGLHLPGVLLVRASTPAVYIWGSILCSRTTASLKGEVNFHEKHRTTECGKTPREQGRKLRASYSEQVKIRRCGIIHTAPWGGVTQTHSEAEAKRTSVCPVSLLLKSPWPTAAFQEPGTPTSQGRQPPNQRNTFLN